MENSLPQGWAKASIGTISSITTGKRDVNEGNPQGQYPFFTCAQDVSRIDNYEFEGQAILVAGNGFFNVKFYEGKFNAYQRTYVLQDFKVLPKYLYYYISGKLSEITKDNRGSTIRYIRLGDLADYEISLPPFAEQHQIVAKLDALMQKVESNKRRLEQVPKILKRFRQSVLNAAVSGKLTNDWRKKNRIEDDWQEIALDTLIPKGGLFDGPFGSNLKTADYTDSGIRVIRLENIEHLDFVSEKETYITEEKYQTLLRHTVGGGDIIFSSFISEEIRACILPELSGNAIAKADCFCIRPDEKKVDKQFLLYSLVSFNSYHQLVLNIHGATRPRINTTQLKSLLIQLPSLPEQHEITRVIGALFAFADKIEARYKKAKAQIDKLPQSILAKAFRGELVPQDMADEPASVLLEKIKRERSAVTSGSKKSAGRKSRLQS